MSQCFHIAKTFTNLSKTIKHQVFFSTQLQDRFLIDVHPPKPSNIDDTVWLNSILNSSSTETNPMSDFSWIWDPQNLALGPPERDVRPPKYTVGAQIMFF